jgi:hypothetical protein
MAATITVPLAEEWRPVAGPGQVTFEAEGPAHWCIGPAASLPASGVIGHYVKSQEMASRTVGTGERLFLRTSPPGGTANITADAPIP